MNDYLTTTQLPMPRRHAAAEVLYGTWGARYVAINIIVRGSAWSFHPSKSGGIWHKRGRWGTVSRDDGPSRRIRKAAKMALRYFMGHR